LSVFKALWTSWFNSLLGIKVGVQGFGGPSCRRQKHGVETLRRTQPRLDLDLITQRKFEHTISRTILILNKVSRVQNST